MKANDSFNNCSNATDILLIQELKDLNFSRCITAAVCALILILLLVILCCSKAYSTMTHRIFLYLIFATLAEEVLFAANLILQPYFKINSTAEDNFEGPCRILGFLAHWSSMCSAFSAAGTIVHTIILMCIIIRYPQCLSTNNIPSCCAPRARKVVVDIVYLSIMILMPLIFVCHPLIKGNYGVTKAWCWIQALNNTDKRIFDQIFYGYSMYEGLGILWFAALVVLSIIYCKLSPNNSRAKVLLFRILMMTMFVLFYIIFVTVDMVVYVYYSRTHLPSYAVVVMQAVGVPIGTLIVPLGFLCSFYYQHFHRTCCARATRRQYEKLDAGKATCPASDRISLPSNTFFDNPYTGGFTSVTEW